MLSLIFVTHERDWRRKYLFRCLNFIQFNARLTNTRRNFNGLWHHCNVEGIQRVFSILGFRTCVPLVADRSHTLNSDWQEPSRLRHPGVSDLAAVAILQEFLHVICMELVLFCQYAVLNRSLLYQYLWISCHKVPKMWDWLATSGKNNLLTPTLFQSFTDGISQRC